MALAPPATLIEFRTMKFLLAHKPNEIYEDAYIKDLEQYNTKTLIRTSSEESYNTDKFNQANIEVQALIFENGSFPGDELINEWIEIVVEYFQMHPLAALAVHCVSGLGRSPVLVAIALMEAGLQPEATIDLIRSKRRGAFNERQIDEIRKYNSKLRLLNTEVGVKRAVGKINLLEH